MILAGGLNQQWTNNHNYHKDHAGKTTLDSTWNDISPKLQRTQKISCPVMSSPKKNAAQPECECQASHSKAGEINLDNLFSCFTSDCRVSG